ncbi:protein C1orf43 homolog [Phymastichus coffea]|uniref:protein C1orf43 homolog n=1 Tax=Phymastichus coffea TaxID=108790 RepID=UPI00273C4D56|nr:protein C1orf43 homolog [Phymastichus coffea]
MFQQLSGVSIILFIAGGVQTILFLFIFAKRQIMRFTIRSRRGPYTPIACDTNNFLKKEIDRRIRTLPKIQYEPDVKDFKTIRNTYRIPSHYHRLQAISDFKTIV